MRCGTGHIRHWFTTYGRPGDRQPFCVRCKAPNPAIKQEGTMQSIARRMLAKSMEPKVQPDRCQFCGTFHFGECPP